MVGPSLGVGRLGSARAELELRKVSFRNTTGQPAHKASVIGTAPRGARCLQAVLAGEGPYQPATALTIDAAHHRRRVRLRSQGRLMASGVATLRRAPAVSLPPT